MSRLSLTRADWERIQKALYKWADEGQSGADFRAAVEEVVRKRMAMAWDRGFVRGWTEGVKDANDDDGGSRPPNPWDR